MPQDGFAPGGAVNGQPVSQIIKGAVELTHSGTTRNQVLVEGKPIELNVHTDSDWPAIVATGLVGVGSILTAIIVAWITRRNQLSQSRATLAGFRKEWQLELRAACSRLVALAKASQIELLETDGDRTNLKGHFVEFVEVTTQIDLLLDPDTKESPDSDRRARRSDLRDSMNEIVDALQKKNIQDKDRLQTALKKFRNAAKLVLEDAWTDVKRDVTHG
jgi:hypothetical protein